MSPSPSAESPESPDSPTTTSPIPPSRTMLGQLFKAPTPAPKSSSLSPESPNPSEPAADADAAPSWSTSAPSDPGPSAAEPSDTRSTGNPGFKLSKAGLKAGIGAIFRQVCKVGGSVVGTQLEREHGVWTPDAEDVEDVAQPTTSIIYRRLPDDAKHGDVIDALAVLFAVVGYLGKSLARRAELRATVAQMEAQGINVHEQEAPAPPTFPGGGF